MKKLIYLLGAAIILTACNGDNSNIDNNEENTNLNENEAYEENENDDNEAINGEEDNFINEEEQNEAGDEDESAVENEAVEPLYEITSISSVKPIEGVDAAANVVLITIDDVFLSTNVYALEMAKILDELDAKAIFFINGLYLDSPENKEILKQIHDMGFEIGNHSMTHPNFSKIPAEEQREQIIELNDRIEEIIGERPRFFRAPHGVNTDVTRAVVEEEGMQWMNWSFGFDFMAKYMEANALTEIMLDPGKDGENVALVNGSNLLFHDRSFTRDALQGIIEGLREKGFEILDPAQIK